LSEKIVKKIKYVESLSDSWDFSDLVFLSHWSYQDITESVVSAGALGIISDPSFERVRKTYTIDAHDIPEYDVKSFEVFKLDLMNVFEFFSCVSAGGFFETSSLYNTCIISNEEIEKNKSKLLSKRIYKRYTSAVFCDVINSFNTVSLEELYELDPVSCSRIYHALDVCGKLMQGRDPSQDGFSKVATDIATLDFPVNSLSRAFHKKQVMLAELYNNTPLQADACKKTVSSLIHKLTQYSN